jgi:hypothetical protein
LISAYKKPRSTGRDNAARTLPPHSASEYQYPILSNILEYLHEAHVTSLRATCKKLRSSLAPTYPGANVSAGCHTMYDTKAGDQPLDRRLPSTVHHRAETAPRLLCIANNHHSYRINTCKGQNHAGIGPMSKSGYWVCQPCHEFSLQIDMRYSPQHQTIGYLKKFYVEGKSTWDVIYDFTPASAKQAAKDVAGALIPVCRDCSQAGKSVRTMMAKSSKEIDGWRRGLCSCLKEFQDEVRDGWYCLDCTLACWDTKFKTPIHLHLDKLRLANRDYNSSTRHGENLRYTCGICERKRINPRLQRPRNRSLRV